MAPEAPGAAITLEDILQHPEWHLKAARRGVGIDTFIAGVGSQYEARPRQLCAIAPCARGVWRRPLGDDSLQGMWGGTAGHVGRDHAGRSQADAAVGGLAIAVQKRALATWERAS